jgi:hypothetical protein
MSESKPKINEVTQQKLNDYVSRYMGKKANNRTLDDFDQQELYEKAEQTLRTALVTYCDKKDIPIEELDKRDELALQLIYDGAIEIADKKLEREMSSQSMQQPIVESSNAIERQSGRSTRPLDATSFEDVTPPPNADEDLIYRLKNSNDQNDVLWKTWFEMCEEADSKDKNSNGQHVKDAVQQYKLIKKHENDYKVEITPERRALEAVHPTYYHKYMDKQ